MNLNVNQQIASHELICVLFSNGTDQDSFAGNHLFLRKELHTRQILLYNLFNDVL